MVPSHRLNSPWFPPPSPSPQAVRADPLELAGSATPPSLAGLLGLLRGLGGGKGGLGISPALIPSAPFQLIGLTFMRFGGEWRPRSFLLCLSPQLMGKQESEPPLP